MRLSLLTATLTITFFSAPSLAESDCSEIAAATVAELRAGAASWNTDIEALVRSAAGAACVKARSGSNRTTVEPATGEAPEALQAPTVAAAENAAAEGNAAADAEAATNADDGKAGWKFLGFDVNSVTGSPGEKPYERKR